MPIKEISGISVKVNEEGYLQDHSQWTREVAAWIAQEEGIQELSDGHWRVIDFLQKDFKDQGKIPSIRRLKKVGGIETKDLYELYPDGPLKKAARIAGLPKPESCV